MDVLAAVPVKDLVNAKQRLIPLLGADERQALAGVAPFRLLAEELFEARAKVAQGKGIRWMACEIGSDAFEEAMLPEHRQ
jgi:hypothetical protein